MSDLVPQPRIIVQPPQDPHYERRDKVREHVRQLAWMLDNAFEIPGTKFRVGVEPLLGLIPIVGDLIGFLVGAYIIFLARSVGVPRIVLARMWLNVMIDAILGAIPFVGDIVDAAWKANTMNAKLLEHYIYDPKAATRRSAWYVTGLSVLLAGVTAATIALFIWLIGLIASAIFPNNASAQEIPKDYPGRLERLKAAKMPAVTKAVSFDTPEADEILAALEVLPPDNPWNQIVEDWPVHVNSKQIVESVGASKVFRANSDMSFVLVPPDQKKVDVKLVGYPDESDKGPFPVPDNVPIEGWPIAYKGKRLSLDDVQRNVMKEEGDRHGIVVDPVNRMLYEFYQLRKSDKGWEATCSATFDLKSNKLRPDGWTSADAAGLPIFPAVVRYDELKRGVVEHALRVTVRRTQRAYVYPATHFASRLTDKNLPRMGERFRLKKDFDTSRFSPEVKTILVALKRYGMFVADNGIEWAISVTPDPRIPELHPELRKIKGSDFEVVEQPAGYKPPK